MKYLEIVPDSEPSNDRPEELAHLIYASYLSERERKLKKTPETDSGRIEDQKTNL